MQEPNTYALLSQSQQFLPLVIATGLNLLGAIAILIVGLWLSKRADQLVVRMLTRAPRFDEMLRGFFGNLARYSILTVTALAVLSRFGIQTTSLVAVLGAAGLAVGLALQGTLSNLAAGVMLLIFRPFRLNDKVAVGGSQGTVKSLSLFWTELVTDDKVQVIIPNGAVWGQALRNFSTYPNPLESGETRFRLPESADADAAAEKVKAAMAEDSRILRDPAPKILFDRTAAENAIEIVARFSCGSGAAEAVRSDMIRALHGAFGPKQ